MKQEKEFSPQGIYTLTNTASVLIEIDSTGESVKYKYSDEETIHIAEIEHDRKGHAHFKSPHGAKYYLSNFMKIQR